MFRCCLPCRGGSAAPATSPPSSPDSDIYTNITVDTPLSYASSSLLLSSSLSSSAAAAASSTYATSAAQLSFANSSSLLSSQQQQQQQQHQQQLQQRSNSSSNANASTANSVVCQSQTSPLPHIEEEEEILDQSHQTSPSDTDGTNGSSVGAGLAELSVYQQKLRLTDRQQHNSSGSNGVEELLSGSPSPRTKQNRKQAKGRTRSVTSATISTGSNSSETVASGGLYGGVASGAGTGSGGSISGNGTTPTAGSAVNSVGASATNINNFNISTNSAQTTSSITLSGFLLPKMQAEQGSIGELQKYHSRYLKNRRHTLANVR